MADRNEYEARSLVSVTVNGIDTARAVAPTTKEAALAVVHVLASELGRVTHERDKLSQAMLRITELVDYSSKNDGNAVNAVQRVVMALAYARAEVRDKDATIKRLKAKVGPRTRKPSRATTGRRSRKR